MKRFIILVFIGAFLTKNAISSKINRYPNKLPWFERAKDAVKEDAPSVCQTEECKKMADMLINSMDKSVDPCDDFYEYACGKWPEHNPIPERMQRRKISTLGVGQLKTNEQMQKLLEAESDGSELLKLAKKWCQVCTDTETMDKQGLESLITTLARAGGWPMVMKANEWNEEEYSWQKVDDQYMRLTGRNTLHDVRIEEETMLTNRQIHVSAPHLPPGSKKLKAEIETDDNVNDDNNKTDKSDEDPSDEEKQSDEQEPGSEGEDSKTNDYDDNDDDNDNDDDDDNEDDDDDNDEEDETNEQDNDKEIRQKNKKSVRNSKRHSISKVFKKHNDYKAEKQRIKRRTITKEMNNKHAQRFTRHRGVLRSRQDKKNHVKKQLEKQMTKSLDNTEEIETTTSQASGEEPDNDNATKVELYTGHIRKVAQLIAAATGNEISEEQLQKDIEDMLKFQLSLIVIASPKNFDIDLDLAFGDETLENFQKWYDEQGSKTSNSKIDWVYKIGLLFDEVGVPVSNEVEVEVGSPTYFKALVSLLDETPSRTIVNYIHWNFISRMLDTLTTEMREINNAWLNVDTKNKNPSNRSDICQTSEKIHDILSYEYVKKYFTEDIVETATYMLDDIQKEEEYLIKTSNWLTHKAKDYALEKLIHMKTLLGYPDWYKNITYIQQYFDGLVVGNSYFENVINYDKYVKCRDLRRLTGNEDKKTIPIDPAEVNAFYVQLYNLLVFTAADFQSPFFAYNRPLAINYGLIGLIMAHEVNHAYDNTGHKFNKEGVYLGWLSAMAKSFGKVGDCFVEQFNNYPIDKKTNLKIKDYGNQTAGDNIADTMGLQAVYRAYQRRQKECAKPDPALPGLEDLTNDQLFFLSFAYLWCENTDPEELIKIAKEDEHCPGRLRVIGSVSNSDDFAKAYNCPVGSPMNPEKKCSVWK